MGTLRENRRCLVLLLGAVLLQGGACASTASAPVTTAQQAMPLEVHFIDVGTGDAILIRTGDDGVPGNGHHDRRHVLIDGGDSGSFNRADGYAAVSAYLQGGTTPLLPEGSRIDWVVMTHPHADHCGGLFGVLQDYQVANILDPGHDKRNDEGQLDRLRPTSIYGRFYAAANNEFLATGEKARFLWGVPDGLTFDLGSEVNLEVLWSSRNIVGNDLNNVSIVLRLSFTGQGEDASFLFTGDAEHFVEDRLVQTLGNRLQTKVLKAGHHGSNSSTTDAFLRAVRPEHVVITVGNQTFSDTALPRDETFQRIKTVSDALSLGTQVWRTDRDDKTPVLKPIGTETGDDAVVARTDGRTIRIDYADQAGPAPAAPAVVDRCQAITGSGTQCKRKPKEGSRFCWQHGAE